MAESGHCAVLQGKAQASLLGTYEPERKAVARANTALSVSNWEQALKVPRALGLDPRAAALLQAAVSSGPASLFPRGTTRWHIILYVWESIYKRAAALLRAAVSSGPASLLPKATTQWYIIIQDGWD